MGKMRYCCQKTIQYPEKISRKSTKRQFPNTVRKLRPTWPKLAVGCSPERRGSRKKISTPMNIRKTLSAARRNTFSTRMRECTQPARNGPAVLPIFTMV